MFFSEVFFDKDFYRFNRFLKDMNPYRIVKSKDKTTIVHNVLGIDEQDLKISIEPYQNTYYLFISGKTEDPYDSKNAYTVDSRFTIDPKYYSEIKWRLKNGILEVDLYHTQPDMPDLKITKE